LLRRLWYGSFHREAKFLESDGRRRTIRAAKSAHNGFKKRTRGYTIMKIFLDTANLDELRRGVSMGVVDGVTTNPTLVAKEGKPFREHIMDICGIVKDGVVNAEVVSTDYAGILREAHELATWHPNIVVKIPMIPDGVRALSVLSKEGIRINITLVFSANQALLVAKAGAYFVSPFVGRLDDISSEGLVLVREILEIYRAYQFPTQVLAASLRGPMHVLEAAKMGAHIGTMPFKVFDQLFHHPLTDSGLAGFLKDWEKARQVLGNIMEPAAARNTAR
jgi:transaldolase